MEPCEIRAALIFAGYRASQLPAARSFPGKTLAAMVQKWKDHSKGLTVDPMVQAARGPLRAPVVAAGSPSPSADTPAKKPKIKRISHAKFEALDGALPTNREALEAQRRELDKEYQARLRPHLEFRKPIPPQRFYAFWRVLEGVATAPQDNEFEAEIEKLFFEFDIRFTRPELDGENPLLGVATVDYFLPDFGLYVEVKHWPHERVIVQMERVMPWPIMVLVRETAVASLRAIFTACAKRLPASAGIVLRPD